jgi:glycosyltransferase involved in cell wall biosynthesis
VDWPRECAAVVPCLNEAATIGGLVEEIRERLPTVFVVDDGSMDETGLIAEDAGAEVLRHLAPEGKGTALEWAWAEAGRQGFSWAICLDGDGQHDPADIDAFLAAAERTSARLIIGNRMDHAATMPRMRRAANRWMSWRLSRLVGCELPDSQCGFRLVHLPTALTVGLRARHFEIESEMVVRFVRAGHRPVFVPIQVRYGDERSKISPLRDTWRWLRWYRDAKRNRTR